MFSEIRRTLSIMTSAVLVLTPMLPAQNACYRSAPIPPQLLNANTVFVSNGGSSNYFETFSGGTNRAYNTFYKQLKQMQEYKLVSSPADADLIFEIRAIAPETSGYHDTVSYNPQVILSIRDPRTNAVLWRESANVRAYGTKSRRDRQFDQSVAVLVDKLALVTGHSLTEAQTKAIAGNSKIPIADKVFIGAAIAGGAAILAVGIHMATSQHQPTLPPVPTPPTPPFP